MRRIYASVMVCIFLLSACGTKAPDVTATTSPTTAPVVNGPQEVSAYHGTWEGTLEGPPGYRIILDCYATSAGVSRALLSIVGETWNVYYTPVNYKAEDGPLRVWLNSEANRMEITFSFDQDGQLIGSFSQYGETATGIFIKTAAEPTLGRTHSKLLEHLFTQLRENSDFDRADAQKVAFTYDYDHPDLAELENRYGLKNIAGTGDTQSRAINLLHWLCGGTYHNGNYGHDERNALALLEYAFGKHSDKGLNCNNLSVILSEACLSVGIQAKALWLMPMDPNDNDCHVVVMVWIPEHDDWIMLDPSFNAYLCDAQGTVLLPAAIREAIASGETMTLNAGARKEYINYVNDLAKDMFYFYSALDTRYGMFDGQVEMAYLCPKDFDLSDWYTQNLRYRYSGSTLSEEEFLQWEERYRETECRYVAYDSFWGG